MDRTRLSCTTLTFGGRLAPKLEAMAAAGFGSTEAIVRLLHAQKRYQIFSVGWRLQRLSTDELRQLSQVNVLLQA